MKSILIFLAVVIFIVSFAIFSTGAIEYGIIGILIAMCCVLSSCLIDSEEQTLILKGTLAAVSIRAQHTHDEHYRLITQHEELKRRFDIIEDTNLRYERMCDNLRILPYTTEGWDNKIYKV